MEVVAERDAPRIGLFRAVPHLVGRPVHEGGASVVDDPSVHRTRKRSAEVRTPVILGVERAVEVTGELVEAMARLGAKVSRTCGLHVHVGVPEGVTVMDALAAIREYWLPVQERFFEIAYGPYWGLTRAYMARARWCWLWSEDQILHAAYDPFDNSHRYHALNPLAVAKHGTLEYRLWPMRLDRGFIERAIRESASHAAGIDWLDVQKGEFRARLQEIRDVVAQRHAEFHRKAVANFLERIRRKNKAGN